jgi:hypothetical protein
MLATQSQGEIRGVAIVESVKRDTGLELTGWSFSMCHVEKALKVEVDSRRWRRTAKSPSCRGLLDGYWPTTAAAAGFGGWSSSDSHVGHELYRGPSSGVVVIGAVEANGQGAGLVGRVVGTSAKC